MARNVRALDLRTTNQLQLDLLSEYPALGQVRHGPRLGLCLIELTYNFDTI